MLRVMRLRIPFFPLLNLSLFAGLCAIVAYWAMTLMSPVAPIAPASAEATGLTPSDPGRTATLFGPPASAPVPTAAAPGPVNLKITGVMAGSAPPRVSSGSAASSGLALISIDGQPAKPFAVGDTLPNGMQVKAIRRDAVEFIDGGRLLTAPAPASPDLSVLVRGPAAASAGASAAAPVTATGPAGSRPIPPVPVTAPVPSDPPTDNTVQTLEAPMPPPPPAPPGGVAPGPLQMPGR